MADLKLRKEEVIKFINIFKTHECLWNYKSPHYKRVDLKTKAWTDLSAEFKTSIENVKRKAKSLRSVYIQEKKKVEASKKSGASSSDLYEPNLFYFDDMKFLDDAIVLRKRTDNAPKRFHTNRMDDPSIFEEAVFSIEKYSEKPGEDVDTSLEALEEHDAGLINDISLSSIGTADSTRKSGRRKGSEIFSKYDDAVSKILNIQEEEDTFNAFAKSVAFQLKELPELNAAEAMAEIQLVILKHKRQVLIPAASKVSILSDELIMSGSTPSTSNSLSSQRYSSRTSIPSSSNISSSAGSSKDIFQMAVNSADIDYDVYGSNIY